MKECNHCNDWIDGLRELPCSIHSIFTVESEEVEQSDEQFDWRAELAAVNQSTIV